MNIQFSQTSLNELNRESKIQGKSEAAIAAGILNSYFRMVESKRIEEIKRKRNMNK